MKLCHSTPWEKFQVIMGSGYISPQRLKDRELSNLSSIGVKGIWLTNKPNYTNNYFGNYGVWFDGDDIFSEYVADCGIINGTATYIAVMPILAQGIGNKIVPVADICQESGFNIIVTTPLPVFQSHHISVFNSYLDRIGQHRNLSEAGWHAPAAKLMAYILLRKESKIASLIEQKDIEEYATAFFWQLIGYSYESRRNNFKDAIGSIDDHDLYNAALELFNTELDDARICAACIKEKNNLAEFICKSLSDLGKIVDKNKLITE